LGRSFFRLPREPPSTGNSLLLFLLRKKAPFLAAVVLLCNPYVAKEAAPLGSFEGAFLERGRKALLADLSQSLEAGSEGEGARGKGWFTRRVCPQVEGTDVQAIVAAEDAIVHLSSKLVRDGLSAAAQLDC
jgi:hypothetical protein